MQLGLGCLLGAVHGYDPHLHYQVEAETSKRSVSFVLSYFLYESPGVFGITGVNLD